MDTVDLTIIGGGVVGLAIASLLSTSHETLVLEANPRFGEETSSRNSEVIHAGIYYPPNSLKARLCIEGKERLYHFCKEHNINHRQCGKLLIAQPGEESALEQLAVNARASGAEELQFLDRSSLRKREPATSGSCALLSPSSGIIDSHGLMTALQGIAESRGATLSTRSRVTAVEPDGEHYLLTVVSAGEPFRFRSRKVVNAAGMGTQAMASSIAGFPDREIPTLYPCAGRYFSYSGPSPFRHLVYPLPQESGLGIHATMDLGGQLRFGPDAEYMEVADLSVPESLRNLFATAISRYFPEIDPARLQPAYAGIRPKLSAPGAPPEDFVIKEYSGIGYSGLVQLFGIESPGLTASLAIAEQVKKLLL